MGSGQKLCRLEKVQSPLSSARNAPSMSVRRIPWPISTRLNPKSTISRIISSPSWWRWGFQHVEKLSMEGGGRLGAGYGVASASQGNGFQVRRRQREHVIHVGTMPHEG